jgi:hypothetical protein
MSFNFTLFAQNSDVDYVQQANVAAMSLRLTNPSCKIALITNDVVDDKYKVLYDHIVDIPWKDEAENSTWKVENRWKIYHATPFDETAVIDTDMLVLSDISHWYELLKTKQVYYVSDVLNYRGEISDNTYYRKAFRNHHLPNLYAGFHWFKKSDQAHEFFKWVETIMHNWELFYGQYAGGKYFQKWPSVDVSSAIAAKVLQCEDQITLKTSYPTFTHMKLHNQNWDKLWVDSWQKQLGVYLDNDCKLTIGNYTQSGIFHYTEDNFCNDYVISTYENKLGL